MPPAVDETQRRQTIRASLRPAGYHNTWRPLGTPLHRDTATPQALADALQRAAEVIDRLGRAPIGGD